MWNKIYLIALAVFLCLMAFLTFYSWSWLGSIGSPSAVVENYNYYSGLTWTFLWISSLILLILGNVLLWKAGRAWALWTTLFYFAAFVIVRYFWLDRSFSQYKISANLEQDGFSVAPLFGALICAVAAIIIFFNQYLIKRLHDKMYPQIEPVAIVGETANENIETIN
jgi:hypothetical protein